MRLTDRTIRKLEPPATGSRITYDDEESGFGIRVTAAGARAFVLNYFIEGRERRMTIGAFPTWAATGAREHAKKLRQQIDRGVDPLAKKQERRAAETFGDLAAEYVKLHASKKKTGSRDEEYLRRDVLPKWGRIKAEDIKRRDVIRLVEAKAEKTPVAGNRLLSLVRKVFRWAVQRDLLKENPCSLVTAPGGKEKPRKRVLGEGEIRTFWTALDDPELSMSPAVRSILKLILTTAQRPGECASMRWADIDASSWWTITETKNQQEQRTPLTRLAREIVNAQPRNGGPFVFPGRRGEKPIEVNALSHALRDAEHLGLPHFTPHDLRRSASDWMARMGIDGRARSAVLNHREASVTEEHYTAYTFDTEKLAALQRWEKKLKAIIKGDSEKVVSIG